MKKDAIKLLAGRPPRFGENLLLEELLFVGNTYVYRGKYPRGVATKENESPEEPTRREMPAGNAEALLTQAGLEKTGALKGGRKPILVVPDFSETGKSDGGRGVARFKYRKRRGAPAGNRNGGGAGL